MSLLRRVIGGVLRRVRLRQGRTLREVAAAAGVSLPYLSEVERGRKEASSEVLAAICRALGINLSDLLEEARDELRRVERRVPVPPGGSLARLDRVPTARQGRTGPGMTTVGRAGPWGTTVGGAGPATVGGAGTGVTAMGGTGMTAVGGFGPATTTAGGFGFGTTTVGVSVRVVAVVSTARPAARTARVPGRRRVGTGRRRLLVG
ncbi:helix-turn-helix domain-containing protein [Micromonospora antibiotica]|uniref:Helix-turn-helix transcriptional regulator n=1 Tax=Micromonospora antibiotica TaxID=2807623 RepID=A0ABS3V3G6_9ACTN|nr:helix-turn-helix transcriptional regulator [Micromonospora antibiotica]MBO4160155.1 helix-turn-helix transcriptional regulator [Micromonospora antibiotica]